MPSKDEARDLSAWDQIAQHKLHQQFEERLKRRAEWEQWDRSRQGSLWDTIPNPPRNVMATDCFMDESGIYIEGGHTRLKLAPALIKKLAGLITIAELAKIVVPDEG